MYNLMHRRANAFGTSSSRYRASREKRPCRERLESSGIAGSTVINLRRGFITTLGLTEVKVKCEKSRFGGH